VFLKRLLLLRYAPFAGEHYLRVDFVLVNGIDVPRFALPYGIPLAPSSAGVTACWFTLTFAAPSTPVRCAIFARENARCTPPRLF